MLRPSLSLESSHGLLWGQTADRLGAKNPGGLQVAKAGSLYIAALVCSTSMNNSSPPGSIVVCPVRLLLGLSAFGLAVRIATA